MREQPLGQLTARVLEHPRVDVRARREQQLGDGDVIAAGRRVARAVAGGGERRRPEARAPVRVGAALEQQRDGLRVAHPAGLVQRRPAAEAARLERDAEVEQDRHRAGPPVPGRLGQRAGAAGAQQLQRRGIRGGEPLRRGAVAAEARAGQRVERPDPRLGAELAQRLRQVAATLADRVSVRRAAAAVVVGLEVGARRREQADRPGRLARADRPVQREAPLAAVGGQVLEQQRDDVRPAAAERVRERVGPRDGRAGVEQQPQARRVRRLDGVVDGLVVVRVRAVAEQERGHPRLVAPSRRPRERALRAELGMDVARVRVRAGGQQRLRGGEQPVRAVAAEVRGVRHVEQREPAARAERRARVDRGRARRAEHERRVGRPAREVRLERQQRVGDVAAPGRRRLHEAPRALVAPHRGRLGVAHERGPGPRAQLARDRQLRRAQPQRRAVAEPRRRGRVARAGRGQQPLRLAPRAFEIDAAHLRSPHVRPRSASPG